MRACVPRASREPWALRRASRPRRLASGPLPGRRGNPAFPGRAASVDTANVSGWKSGHAWLR
eukprot:5494709-Alexandrium_andersonii.AAC.1